MQVDLTNAARACEAGRLGEAEAICRQALTQNPRDYRALHLLGIVAGRAEQHEIAADLMRKSVMLAPQVVPYRSNLATALIEIGSLDEAEETINAALKMKPDDAELHVKLGAVLTGKGDAEAGMAEYKKALQLDPQERTAHFNIAEAYRRQGNTDAAVSHLQETIKLDPYYADAYNNLAGLLLDRGEFLDGLGCLEKLLKLRPRSAQAYANLGMALRVAGDTEQALVSYRNALKLDSSLALPWYDMATLHVTAGDLDKALESIEELERVAPDDPRVVIGKAKILERKGELAEAAEMIAPTFAEHPLNPACATTFAVIQEQLGEREKAAAALQAVFDAKEVVASEGINTRFALGKIYDAMGEYDLAWENYQAGNANRKRAQIYPHNPEGAEREFDKLIETFSPERFADYPRATLGSGMPIFIVGMPRSGTTLVEQIVSSHHEVFGAGELSDIAALVRATAESGDAKAEDTVEAKPVPFRIIDGDGTTGGIIPDMEQITSERLNDLATRYLDKLRSVGGDASRVTDKMPYNFLHVPFMRLLFPDVPIIHCRRNPLDTCLSCYFQNFYAGNEYAFNLEHLGTFYRQYLRVMAAWRETVTHPIFEVQYEDLVSDPEPHVRAMLEYCGLEWDENCMKFHESKRVVLTASYQQVRKPMYTKSVKRWEHYRKHLGPLIEQLGSEAGLAETVVAEG